ncbi:hypothetical protein HELRODRAFT_173312 [Helobdella robusta]|uniref:Uncharacterized protein n=1 Tax=Helobdella robusta TaxID=6412 RepID=T1F6N8_HELRO|nr:hypothetical protein HELRODRAFT_173312 [Helobdella robusta]ESO03619.1 hypothetical protein HELRODRAFT_173312 [Helobdella robusta]
MAVAMSSWMFQMVFLTAFGFLGNGCCREIIGESSQLTTQNINGGYSYDGGFTENEIQEINTDEYTTTAATTTVTTTTAAAATAASTTAATAVASNATVASINESIITSTYDVINSIPPLSPVSGQKSATNKVYIEENPKKIMQMWIGVISAGALLCLVVTAVLCSNEILALLCCRNRKTSTAAAAASANPENDKKNGVDETKLDVGMDKDGEKVLDVIKKDEVLIVIDAEDGERKDEAKGEKKDETVVAFGAGQTAQATDDDVLKVGKDENKKSEIEEKLIVEVLLIDAAKIEVEPKKVALEMALDRMGSSPRDGDEELSGKKALQTSTDVSPTSI